MVATWLPICMSQGILTNFFGVLFTQPLGDYIYRGTSPLHTEILHSLFPFTSSCVGRQGFTRHYWLLVLREFAKEKILNVERNPYRFQFDIKCTLYQNLDVRHMRDVYSPLMSRCHKLCYNLWCRQQPRKFLHNIYGLVTAASATCRLQLCFNFMLF